MCVLDYEAVRSVLDASALKGRTLVNLTGGSPPQAREMAAWAAEHGIHYLDGVILNGVVGGPEAALLYSGPDDVYQEHRTALAALGENGTYLGADPGRAAAFNVSLLDLFWTSMFGVAHAFRLAAAQDIAAGRPARPREGDGRTGSRADRRGRRAHRDGPLPR